jgi:tRNA(Glu) U13 pseudouridine synthase TruD
MDAFVKKKMKNTDKDDDGDKKVEKKGGKLLAAKLSFKLGAGNYATMILRELTKAQAREYSSHENGDK